MQQNAPTDFDFADLAPIEVGPFAIGPDKYIIREASAGAKAAYGNVTTRSTKVAEGSDGIRIATFDGLADAEVMLVSLCLHKLGKNDQPLTDRAGNPAPTPIDRIRAWPDRIVSQLFDTIKEISPRLTPKEDRDTLEKRLADTQKKLADLDGAERKAAAKAQANVNEGNAGPTPEPEGDEPKN